MHWGNFSYILLFVLFFIVLSITKIFQLRAKKIVLKYKNLPTMINKNRKREFIKKTLFIIGLSFLILAIMEPRWGVKEKTVRIKGEDVIFAVDVSNSMLSQDISPSRLERVKNALSKTMDSYYGGFVGLIAFAGESKIVVPLTLDYEFVKYNVKTLSPATVSLQGTNFKDLISLVSLVFRSREAKRKLIILSDGEDTESNLKDCLKIAKESGIQIFTIAVGTLKGARIPLYNKNGKIVGFKQDKDGNYVISKLNIGFLKRLAEESNGKFYFSLDLFENIKKALKYEPSKGSNKINVSLVEYKEKYYYFAIIGFLFLLFSSMMPIGEKGFNKIFLLILIFILNMNSSIIDKGNYHNNKGVKKYKKGEYSQALKEFQKAKDYAMYDKKLDFNIGDSLYKLKKDSEAEKYFKSGAESKNKDLRKFSLYNLGNLYLKRGNFNKAAESYKNALKIDPNFFRAKKNLEIVLKKMRKQKRKRNEKNKHQKKEQKNSKNDKSQSKNKKMDKKKDKQTQNMKKNLLNNLLKNLKKREAKRRDKMMKALKRRKSNGKKKTDKDW